MDARQVAVSSCQELGGAKSQPCLPQAKNTFIHTDSPRVKSSLRRSRSLPAFRYELSEDDADDDAEDLPHGASDEEQTTFSAEEGSPPSPEGKNRAHHLGNCRPCMYFHFKKDGCRRGDACDFCHLCTKEAAMKYKQALKRSTRRGKNWTQDRATTSKAILTVPMRAVCSFAARRGSHSQGSKADVQDLLQSFLS
eukprot:TRINITY_DN4380_c0_g2_i1.p1 TRINITY_DN4380_c0_g2~~TRINITY_DN4380_c0_g2_i1.p1  ORF type:complete len:214 (-),score=26.24 TRINITY_DN4380_c0_g2_i1:295-879(-)